MFRESFQQSNNDLLDAVSEAMEFVSSYEEGLSQLNSGK